MPPRKKNRKNTEPVIQPPGGSLQAVPTAEGMYNIQSDVWHSSCFTTDQLQQPSEVHNVASM